MAASTSEIDEFLSGPLVKWLSTCVKKAELLEVYETFFDGSPIKEVLLLIDPEPSQPIPSLTNLQAVNIIAGRIKIFSCIFKNIKAIYEELGHVVICLPDYITLGSAPRSQIALNQLKTLILLLLGCAVQGPTKQLFISKIKELSLEDQHSIVECIKQVTDEENLVLSLECNVEAVKLLSYMKSLTEEHEKIVQHWLTNVGNETFGSIPFSCGVESNHLAVELADSKARLRKLRQELEEKTELLAECKEELKHTNTLITKLKSENCDLLIEARQTKIYRDEVDSMRERLERAEQLELDVQKYRERLADAEFYKTRVEELREDNRVLHETQEMLEAQIARARLRSDHVLELEAELLGSKQAINDVILERDAARSKIQELLDENIRLQQEAKSIVQEILASDSLCDDEQQQITSSEGNNLSEQIISKTQARVLRLELENKRLLSTIESLKESSLHENNNKIIDIKKENKKMLLKCEQLEENIERLMQQKGEIEHLLKNAIQENHKLHENLTSEKLLYDKINNELQMERSKVSDLEDGFEVVTKEKQKLQTLCDSLKNKNDDMEKSHGQVMEQIDKLQIESNKVEEYQQINSDMKKKIILLEKENVLLQKDVEKLKETVERTHVELDQLVREKDKFEKESIKLAEENTKLGRQVEKLQEIELKNQELSLQYSMSVETVETLQKDLISEKVTNEKIKNNLDKLGLTCEILESDINLILQELIKHPEISQNLTTLFKSDSRDKNEETPLGTYECNKIQMEIANLQVLNDSLQNENATLKVDLSTFKSQLNSLQTQQTALQFANSQLVAEKDELTRKMQIQSTQHDTLLLDQIMLRSLHEQLSLEYEESRKEQEYLKKISRDLRSEMRTISEKNNSLENKIISLETEKEVLENTARNLVNLRSEHSKLKEDFRNLFTASERVKQEYEVVQNELKTLRMESRTLRLGHTEMQGELNCKSDKMANLQLENTKLQHKCDMLLEMNNSLDSDRRALMEHVSQLLTQYHSLLTHSLEDKQHFHSEEKLYTDKLYNLCRQKEKLEEKIMEHYRKLENASSKKKSFGASLVRRVRKAGSDMLNKVPKNRKSWHEESAHLNRSQFSLSGESSIESNGNNSDNSIHDSSCQQPISERNLPVGENETDKQLCLKEQESSMSLGSVGSRRTVYLSENNMSVASTEFQNNEESNSNPPILIYNRISTAVGEISSPQIFQPEEEKVPPTNTTPYKKSSEETAIWYEYGCV